MLTVLQPADSVSLASSLANLHKQSQSPCGKFGFHIRTWHGAIDQAVDSYDESWAVIFARHLRHIMDTVEPKMSCFPGFKILCDLIMSVIVPRLLQPLQENGRYLKPSLVHGDCWDGNTALDFPDGRARIFDVCSFYAHNEYDIGNWRAPRHRVSNYAYLAEYKKRIQPSEPAEDWDARQLLYSLCFNMGNVVNIPDSVEGPVYVSSCDVDLVNLLILSSVYDDMLTLCKMFCMKRLRESIESFDQPETQRAPHVPGAEG